MSEEREVATLQARVEIPKHEPEPPELPFEQVLQRSQELVALLRDEDPRTLLIVMSVFSQMLLGPWEAETDDEGGNYDYKRWVRRTTGGEPYVRVLFEDEVGATAHFLVEGHIYEEEFPRLPSSIGVAMLFADHNMRKFGRTLVGGSLDSEDQAEQLMDAIKVQVGGAAV